MSSILTDAQKAALVNDFKGVIDTFVRPLVVYQEASKTVIISNPNFNPIEQWSPNGTEIQNTPVYSTISGRILYDKGQEDSFVRPYPGRGVGEGQIKVKDDVVRSMRLKVDLTGYRLIRDAKKVQVDGHLFDNESVARPHGLFGAETYTFYFVRSQ